ncbi:phage terminase small subunit P27 family [Methylocapsa aurea]|uniref:phage terminase small subunit P27 family n=1 Tax=Methylocapsa aurea TaxID=663610 RepID=UPI00056421B2|nr:phage terminase small subunit P27 family [Methylocapsa aurea]
MTRGCRPKNIVKGSSTLDNIPKCPAWLSSHAKSEWKRVAPILVERNVLTEADLPTLESYCCSVGTIRECQTQISRDGITVVTPHGIKRHPAVGIQNAAQTTARLLANELGLTPVSRSRPSVRDQMPEGEDDLGLD